MNVGTPVHGVIVSVVIPKNGFPLKEGSAKVDGFVRYIFGSVLMSIKGCFGVINSHPKYI